MSNAFTLLRLPPMSDREKDTEILSLHHQIMVLDRQLGDARPRFTTADRAFLAALLHRLPAQALRRANTVITAAVSPYRAAARHPAGSQ
ncbi:hypothetical protein LZG04_39310 [Saccharothrix sp. S26]|uniref:hypothetical protein n=1 Tax=Saccharothrix sp. S26 TaxID=2907215 RepID=UPI001F3C1C26|nr:hypothetical protein [Saccharothrix sp. S26]MCE7000824.1 hypothetical protein [Saccharothrix sp. S26]